jgi:Acetyltransferase (GNAT) domain
VKASEESLAVTSPASREAWESLLKSDSNALVTQSLPWRDALFADGRFKDVSRLYEFPSGRRILLPLAQRRLHQAGSAVISSWPQPWAVGGPICQDGRVSKTEAAAVLADVARRPALAAEVKLRHDADQNWLRESGRFQVQSIADWILDLNGGFADIWEHKFQSSVRRAVRKAERSALDVQVDRSGQLLGCFHELFEKSILRWSAMQNAPVWLTRRRLRPEVAPARAKLIADSFGADFAIWLASSRGEPVAAIAVISHGAYAKYLWGAMDKDAASPVRAPDLLHRLAIEEACRQGCLFYDFGGARPESSLAAFKRKFGAAELYRHTLRMERVPISRTIGLPKALIKKTIGFRDNV